MGTETGASEVIGYVIPWPVFLGAIPGRVCVQCYATRGGPRNKPLTREQVAAEMNEMRARGVGNFGGADSCWVCQTSFLTGKRVSDLRVIKPEEQKILLPPPPGPDAPGEYRWYLAYDAAVFYCRHCQDYEWEPPCVIQYYEGAEALVIGKTAKREPAHLPPKIIAEWREKGWLAWFSCDNCAWVRYQSVTQKQVKKWGRDCGGWHLRKTQDGQWV